MELKERIRNPNSAKQSRTSTTALEIFAAVPIGAGRRCDNEFCTSRDPWPLHHVTHRANFGRLCTSCVLRHHRGFFCSACLEVFDSPPMLIEGSDVHGVARCIRCPAVAHSACLRDDSVCNYVCPFCEDPEEFSYFPVGDNGIDAVGARALLSASRIAAASMRRGAAAARLAAERKMKQAAEARKMAKEMLERVMLLCDKRKEETEGGQWKGRMKEISSSGIKNGALKVKNKKKKKKKQKMVISLSTPIGLLKKS